MKKTAKWIAALAVACAVALAGCKVVSEPEPIAVQSVTINTTTLTLAPGDTDRLSATVLPLNADNRTVTWSSSDRSVASVIYDGTITAEGEGKATITAQAGNQLATCEVTVKHKVVAVSYFTINESSITLDPGTRRILTATIYPDNATDKSVTWSSSNPDVATVENNGISDGMITAISPGTAIITAQSVGNGDMVQCLVTVNETEQPDYTVPVEVESITLDAETLTLGLGKTRTLKATVMPWSEGAKTVTWSSSDETIATVDDDGTVTATFTEGTAIITAQAGGKTAECVVTVQPISVAVERVTLDHETLTLKRGETGKLTATVTPDDADDKTVAWSCSDPYYAIVDHDGTITTHHVGFTYIFAKAGDEIAECRVYVEPPPVESITLNITTIFLTPGEKCFLCSTVTPDDVDDDDKTVIWTSSNISVATVNEDGIVTAHTEEGTATITAQAGGKTATCKVTVHNHYYSGGKCTVCGANPTMKYGTINKDGVLTKYSSYETTVEIPYGVTGIGNNAFYNTYGNPTTKSITIPNSVKSIGSSAFRGCTSLASVSIPAGVTSIESNTFYGCKGLTNITIPNSVTSIGNSAFNGCTSLTNVTIPNSVTGIGNSAFSGCTSLTNVTIPNSVTGIGNSVFSGCTSLTNVTIPNSVTSIGNSAYSDCTSLKSVTIPNSVTSIGNSAFSGCTSLKNVKIPASVTSIGDSAFENCWKTMTIEFEGTIAQWNAIAGSGNIDITRIICSDGHIGVKDIPAYLNMSNKTVMGYTDAIPANLVIPDGVTSIANSTFYLCSSLKSVTIPTSVTSIGNYAFNNCQSLSSVTIPDSVTSIGNAAFVNCTSLTSVTIPDSVTEIGSGMFQYCTNLRNVTIGNGVTSIGSSAFYGCKSLSSVTIPKGVTSIESATFSGCTSLTKVTIPDSVTSIVSGAFNYCQSLSSVTIPGSVTSWDYAFEKCTGLTSVVISNGVTSIAGAAFSSCTNLTSVTIPASVTSIESGAFNTCTSLKTVNYSGTKAQWNAITKGTTWNSNTGSYTIICTDGSLSK